MNVSEVFIRRPIATALLMAAICLFGMVGYELMPVAALPNVEFPTIAVAAQLPGASPTIMAETVATPLESEFTQIPGLSQMTSTSGLGTTSITLQFDLSVDINAAAGQVQQEINAASGLLPKTLPTPPTYKETNPANRPILIYAVHSDAMPEYQLDTYTNTVLSESLSTIPGVGYVVIAGQQQPAVAVQVDPGALASRGLSMAQVQTALSQCDAQFGQGQSRRSAAAIHAQHQRSTVRRQRIPERHHRLPERRPGHPKRHRRCHQFIRKSAHRRLVRRQARRTAPDLPHRRCQYRSGRRRYQGKDAAARSIDPSVRARRFAERPFTGHPGFGARRGVDAADYGRAGRLGHFRLSAQAVGDDYPERDGAAGHRRHIRADVFVRLQPRQSVADGA